MCVCVCKYLCNHFSLCVVVNIFLFVNIFVKKKKLPCTLRSNAPCTFERRHKAAFELTCICSTAAPHLTHTLLHACV
jgi:hypothetical protein